MTAERLLDMESPARSARRPRVALMGEFSAGKSTLANLLLGQSVSPVKVTATQVPPVWYAHGARSTVRIGNDGSETAIGSCALDAISHRDTQAIRVHLEAEVLEFCDLIDMPGTSDPNMPGEIWERMLSRVDGVVWCTPAAQAWRQSEAALWEQVPEALRARSLLLVTRIDKLVNPSDRERVLSRVRREAGDLFAQVLPISLTEAIAAGDNIEALERSGAERFVETLVEIVGQIGTAPEGFAPRPEDFGALPAAVRPMAADDAPAPASAQDLPACAGISVVPRRVTPKRVRRQNARP